MSIPVDECGKPDYTNCSQFPMNIYKNSKVLPLPYYTRDIIPSNIFEYRMDQRNTPALFYGQNPFIGNPNPKVPGRFGWTPFSNGYGEGNLVGHNNCAPGCGAFGCCNKDVAKQEKVSCQKYDKNCFPYHTLESSVNKFCVQKQQGLSCDSPNGRNGVKFISDKTLKIANAYANSYKYKYLAA